MQLISPEQAQYWTDLTYQGAQQRGMDPNIVVNGFKAEALGSQNYQSTVPTKNGGREESYGPLQFFIGGGMGNDFMRDTGLDPRDPNTVPQQINYGLDRLQQGGWTPWHGPTKQLGYDQWHGIRGGGGGTQVAQAAPQQDFADPNAARQYLAQTPDAMVPAPMFDPAQPAPAQLPQTQAGAGSLHDRWTQFLSNDDNRAALFQLGISLLQPISPGQSAAGQIGQALGQAGEVYGTREAMRAQNEALARGQFNDERNYGLAQQKLGLERQQVGAQSDYYRARGNAAMLKAAGAGAGAVTPFQMAKLRASLAGEYTTYQANAALTGETPQPFEQWVQQFIGGGGGAPTPAPPQGQMDPTAVRSSSTYQQAKQQYQQAAAAGNGQLANQVREDIINRAAQVGVDLSADFPPISAAARPVPTPAPNPAAKTKPLTTNPALTQPLPQITVPAWLRDPRKSIF